MAENAAKQNSEVVVDKASSSWSDLWKKEDYWAIWLGFLILTVGAIIFFNNKPADMEAKFAKQNAIMTEEAARAPFKTVAWYEAQTAKEKIKAKNAPIGKAIKGFMNKPQKWTTNPLDAFIQTKEQADAKNAAAMPKYNKSKSSCRRLCENNSISHAQLKADQAGFKDASLNTAASASIESWLKLRAKESLLPKRKSRTSLLT